LIGRLQSDSKLCEIRLQNAEKLIFLLVDEGRRWEQTIEELQHKGKYISGDVFIATAEMCYLGPFSGTYREQLIA
jgi:dynein heavy chain